MYIRLPALDSKSSTCNSQQQTSSSKVIPSNFNHFLRLMPFMGPGGGLKVPPLKSISHVFDKFKVILFLTAQFSMCFTSSIEESSFDLTGALTVISSANLINKSIYVHNAAKFYFGDLSGAEISPYADPNLSGTWKVVKAFIDPIATHTFTAKFKVGKTRTKSVTEQHGWKVSVGAAIGWFQASAEYSGFIQKASSNTWSSEYEETTTIKVEAGKTVVVWRLSSVWNNTATNILFRVLSLEILTA